MTKDHGLPIVRACQVARLSRAAYYKSGTDWAARDGEVIAALQAIVVKEQRWGFWKCHDRLRAQGYVWNHKRIWRVYCQLRLNLPRRTKRRVPQRVRQPLLVEPRMNAVWAIDFMRDTLYSGRVFRTLNVIDEANRGALGIDVAVSIPAARLSAFLAQRPVHTIRNPSAMSAKLMKAMNMTSSFSNREKIRRKPLSRRNSRSISLRRLYMARLYSHGVTRFCLGGTTGMKPRSSASCRVSSPSYARSISRCSGQGALAETA